MRRLCRFSVYVKKRSLNNLSPLNVRWTLSCSRWLLHMSFLYMCFQSKTQCSQTCICDSCRWWAWRKSHSRLSMMWQHIVNGAWSVLSNWSCHIPTVTPQQPWRSTMARHHTMSLSTEWITVLSVSPGQSTIWNLHYINKPWLWKVHVTFHMQVRPSNT